MPKDRFFRCLRENERPFVEKLYFVYDKHDFIALNLERIAERERVMTIPPIQPKVLVVEDDDVTAFLTNRVIQDSGLFTAVEWVRDGEQALERVATTFQLIFLDLSLPVVDGPAFLEIFHKRCEEGSAQPAPIVLLSSSDTEELDDLIHRFPMVVGSAPKPLTLKALQQAMQEASL